MSDTLRRVIALISDGQLLISTHSYDEMAEDGILDTEAVEGAEVSTVVEDYPDYAKGPCTLVLQRDRRGRPIHVDTMDGRLPQEESMSKRRHTKLVREGTYAAEVDVELIDADGGWAPYLSLSDAGRLDEVRQALRRGDVQAASQLGRVFSLTPLPA